MFQAKSVFPWNYSQKLLFVFADLFSKTTPHCSLFNCRYHMLLIAENVMKEMFHQLRDVQLTYQFVDCFHTVFNMNFKGREGQVVRE